MDVRNATFSLTSTTHAVPFIAKVNNSEQSIINQCCSPEQSLQKRTHGCLKVESRSSEAVSGILGSIVNKMAFSLEYIREIFQLMMIGFVSQSLLVMAATVPSVCSLKRDIPTKELRLCAHIFEVRQQRAGPGDVHIKTKQLTKNKVKKPR